MNQALLTITGGPAYPVHFSLVEYIERIIHRYPSNAAAFDEDQRLTYSELRIELLTLHARLHELGVRSGDVVAVNATVQLRYPVVVLGLLLAGLVYLPIAAALPPERKRAICEQARPALMITDEQKPDDAIPTCTLSSLFSGKPVGAAFDLFPEPSPEATAYLIFTSGSTGVPKGVSITRKGFFNRLQWAQDYYALGSEDVTALKTQASFDPSIQEAVLPFSMAPCSCLTTTESTFPITCRPASLSTVSPCSSWYPATCSIFSPARQSMPASTSGISFAAENLGELS